MSDKYNKDEESLLQKIQNKTGCLLLVIGVAMLAFVLTDLVGSGTSIFGSADNGVGSIGGESISYDEFNATYENLVEQVQVNNPGFVMDENMKGQYRQQAWNQMVQSKTLKPQYEMLGISVSPAELEDLTIGANTHPQIQQSFKDPKTGAFDKQRLIRFLKDDVNANPQALASWESFQTQFTEGLTSEKYSNFIGSSYYTSELEARLKSKEQASRSVNIVALSYAQNTDSTLKVSEKEIMAYANKHEKEFELKASRDIEYVRLNVVPSTEDSAKMMEDFVQYAQRFATEEDDSAFVSLMNSDIPFDPTYRGKDFFAPDVAAVLFNIPVGQIVGPIQKFGVYSIFKVTGTGTDTSGNKTIQVATLEQKLYAGSKTDGEYYRTAGELITQSTGDVSFEEAAEKLGLTKRVANKITEETRVIPGIQNTSKIARWLFTANEGDISNIIDLNGSYIVARVSKVREAGMPEADDLRSQVESIVLNQKKAEAMRPKVSKALESASNADDLAAKLGTTATNMPALSAQSGNIPYLGNDKLIIGQIMATPVGKNTGIIEGRTGLAVGYVQNDNEQPTPNLGQIQKQTQSQYKQQARNMVPQVLEEIAKVKDTRYKFYD